MTLSVCFLTSDPGPRVHTLLESVRPAADEIIVAVDARVDPARLGHLAAVSDRLFRYEFEAPHDRAVPWLHSLCSGDWILLLDSNQVLSPELIRQLPELCRGMDLHQYHLPFRWLYPDRFHFLDQHPWDRYPNRIVRNDPARKSLSGFSPNGAKPIFPSRYLPWEGYQLGLLSPAQERLELARTNWATGTSASESVNRLMLLTYVPECVPGAKVSQVPEEDLPGLSKLLEASGPDITMPDVEIPIATRKEIDAHWAGRGLEPDDYRASLELLDRDCRFVRNEHRPLHVRVTNLGNNVWPGGDDHPWIRISYHLSYSDGRKILAEGFRSSFPAAVKPGGSCVVPTIVAAPAEQGEYLLELDLVHEFVRWFGCDLLVGIEVV